MEDKNGNDNDYFQQFINYYISNQEMIKIFNGENEEESKKDWSEKLFHLISRDWIKEWKSFIGFDNIVKELKSKNKKEIQDKDKIWISTFNRKKHKWKTRIKKIR